MKKEIIYYEDSRFTVEYEIENHYIKFYAMKDECSTDISEVEGYLKWDGCMNVTCNSHYCGLSFAKEYLTLITTIYQKGIDTFSNCDYELKD
jgi:hypothetical protein